MLLHILFIRSLSSKLKPAIPHIRETYGKKLFKFNIFSLKMNSSQNIEKIVMGAFLVLSSIILGKLFSYLYIVLVAVKLGSQEYGLLSLGMATLSLFSAFSLLGLDEGVLRFIPFYKGKNDQKLLKSTIMTSLKTVLNSSLFFSILIIVFSGFISDKIFNEYELEKVLLFMAIALPFSAVSNIFLVSFR